MMTVFSVSTFGFYCLWYQRPSLWYQSLVGGPEGQIRHRSWMTTTLSARRRTGFAVPGR